MGDFGFFVFLSVVVLCGFMSVGDPDLVDAAIYRLMEGCPQNIDQEKAG